MSLCRKASHFFTSFLLVCCPSRWVLYITSFLLLAPSQAAAHASGLQHQPPPAPAWTAKACSSVRPSPPFGAQARASHRSLSATVVPVQPFPALAPPENSLDAQPAPATMHCYLDSSTPLLHLCTSATRQKAKPVLPPQKVVPIAPPSRPPPPPPPPPPRKVTLPWLELTSSEAQDKNWKPRLN